MVSRSIWSLSLAAALVTSAFTLSGCTSCYQQQPKRKVVQPATTGAAATIEVSPAVAVNPVRTQHVLVATVRDAAGNPVAGERVEWILTEGSTGAIVDVAGGEKIDNGYAVSTTASGGYVLDRGNADSADDVQIGPGQTWCVITSAEEGTSNIVAYAPGIANWDYHKAFATKNWMDVTWEWPVDATNRVGTPHVFSTRVMRYSDGTPLVGYIVNYEILGGPAGSFQGGGQAVSVKTDASGVASATLNQAAQATGVNDVEVTIVRPANVECCIPEKVIIAGVVRKMWVAPSIAIQKTAPATAVEGDTFNYDIVVSNTSDLDVRNTTVTDVLPDGIKYVSSVPAASVSGQRLTWDLGTLEAMGSRSLSVTVQALRPGTFENCADVVAEGGALTARSCAVTVVEKKRVANLAITCTCPQTVLVCDPIVWRCTVTNNGDGDAQDVRVICSVPEGLVCDGQAGQTEHYIGTLGPGQSRVIESTCTASRTGTFTKTCRVTAANANTAEASCTTTVQQPALAITKKAGASTYVAGRAVSWEITVRSTGDVAARDVVLTDMIPAGTTFDGASDGGMLQGGQVVWNLGTLDVGQSRTVTLTVIANQIGQITNTATARAYCASDVTADASTTVTGVAAILLECIDVDDPIEVGGTETYVIDVTNQGTIDDHNVVIEVTLPAQQEFVSAEGHQGVRHSVSGKVVTFAPLATLAPKARATYRVTVRATGTGDVRFAVKLTSDELDSPVNETESTHQY